MSEQPNDTELVQECLKGDRGAFERLVERYQKKVFNAAYRLVNDAEEARDIAQSVFMKVYEKLETFDTGFKFYGWVYRITVNEAINALNKQKSLSSLDSVSDIQGSEGTGPESAYEKDELGRHVQRALMSLKPEYRIVIVLRHFLDCSYAEMARITKLSEKTVKSRLFTARRLLRDCLVERGVVR